MPLPIWPTSLPQRAMRDAYNENYPNNLLRSGNDSGVAKVRRKGATPPFTMTVAFLITNAQRVTLRNFVQNTLSDGALRFEFVHPLDETTFEARLIAQDKSLYTVTPLGLDFRVSLLLEVMP